MFGKGAQTQGTWNMEAQYVQETPTNVLALGTSCDLMCMATLEAPMLWVGGLCVSSYSVLEGLS